MKYYVKYGLAVLLLAILSLKSKAQDMDNSNTSSKPAWIPENGYWVVESNIKTPKHAIVYFYSDNNTMIYREEIEGIKLNLKKEKTKMKLKKLLESALWAWETKKPMTETTQMVSATFSH